MSMSTNIADLPGPKPEEFEDEEYEYEEEMMEEEELQPPQQLQREVYYEQPSSIKMDIKKVKRKVQEEEESM